MFTPWHQALGRTTVFKTFTSQSNSSKNGAGDSSKGLSLHKNIKKSSKHCQNQLIRTLENKCLQQSNERQLNQEKGNLKIVGKLCVISPLPHTPLLLGLAVVLTRSASYEGPWFLVLEEQEQTSLAKNCVSVLTCLGQPEGLIQALIFVSSNLELRIEMQQGCLKNLARWVNILQPPEAKDYS